MYTTRAAAEKAAIDGEAGDDFDTQQCQELQAAILSSSPRSQRDTAFAIENDNISVNALRSARDNLPDESCKPDFSAPKQSHPVIEDAVPNFNPDECELQLPEPKSLLAESNPQSGFTKALEHGETSFHKEVVVPVQHGSCESHPTRSTAEGAHAKISGIARMDSPTQRSSMSPTQEHTPSLYLAVEKELEEISDDDRSGTATTIVEHSQRQDSVAKQLHSVITNSTAHTWERGDTGHVELEVELEQEVAEESELVSQDESFAPYVPQPFSTAPETPAPVVNPFLHKGSVLKGHEMFGATQPSSIGKQPTPTSSRPSPDIYHNFANTHNQLQSSPLPGRVDLEITTSPVQSTVRQLLRSQSARHMTSRDESPQTPAPQSFPSGPRTKHNKAVHEPRPYVSMKESQEKRRTASVHDLGSDTGSDFEGDTPKRNHLLKQQQERIRQELAAVGIPPSDATTIEVPSTGKRNTQGSRRSEEQSGRTTSEDVIADSQSHELPVSDPPESSTTDSSAPIPTSEDASRDEMPTSPLLPDQDSKNAPIQDTVIPRSSDLIALANPSKDAFQEQSSTRLGLRTPVGNRIQVPPDIADTTVPETSPPGSNLQPLGGIAKISFAEDSQSDRFAGIGFTQDPDFESVVESEPSPPRKVRTRTPLDTKSSNSTVIIPASSARSESIPLSKAAMSGIGSAKDGNDVDSELVSMNHNEEAHETPTLPKRKSGSTSRSKLKGPMRLRTAEPRGATPTKSIKLQAPGVPESSSGSKTSSSRTSKIVAAVQNSTPMSSLPPPFNSSELGSLQSTPAGTPVSMPSDQEITSSGRLPSRAEDESQTKTPMSAPTKSAKRRAASPARKGAPDRPTRASKRQSLLGINRESTVDPLNGPNTTMRDTSRLPLFGNMAFAVSYVNDNTKEATDKGTAKGTEETVERAKMSAAIVEHGGTVLTGFDVLFEATSTKSQHLSTGVTLSSLGKSIGFAAVIADEHSRTKKYMQALALGLPCISGRWITDCVSKGMIVKWTPYLLCAGRSSFLGDALRSRMLKPYSAEETEFATVFAERDRLLDGKSIILVTGKGIKEETRDIYLFLIRLLGPAKIEQIPDFDRARRKLQEAESRDDVWDMLYVEGNEQLKKSAGSAVFGATPSSTASKKRKRGYVAVEADLLPPPKKIRVINKEDVLQSLILGQWIEE